MTVNEKMLQGSRSYMTAIANCGREDVIDQIQNHCIVSARCRIGVTLIVTEKYVICTGKFIIAHEDIELFYLSDSGWQDLIVYDRYGAVYMVMCTIPLGVLPEIRAAVRARAYSATFDYSVNTQLDYKRRHRDDLERNARAMLGQVHNYRYGRNYLYHDNYIMYIVIFIITIGLVILEMTAAKGVGQIIAGGLIVAFFGAGLAFFIKSKAQADKTYKAYVKANEDEVLDQINNHLLYTVASSGRRGVFVTEKYLIITGSIAIRREDVVWFRTYTHKGHFNTYTYDRSGICHHGQMPCYGSVDWMREEQVVGSLLPNAAVGHSEENKAYAETYKNN